MSVTYINAELRRFVAERASRRCEYCLIHQGDTFFGCQVDHIISEKHGGPTQADNLAYACVFCNQAKGSDIGSMDWKTGQFVRFFHPRLETWREHFALDDALISPLTPIGEATARILGFNTPDRILERRALQAIGRYGI